ncbi:MAG: glycosyltransferase family 4 protein [Nanoarchaeota archaeon]|nr:glycosyltransferase family 4 protein [Nanoarchaeota archaeon]
MKKSKILKILFVTEYYPPVIAGGGETSAEILAESIAGQGHTVHILTSHFKELKKAEYKNKVKIFRLLKTGNITRTLSESMKRQLLFSNSVKRIVRNLDNKENYDIIHCLNNSSTIGVSKIQTDAKLVSTINSYVNLCPKANLFYMEKSACSGCKPSKFMKCIMHSEYGGLQKIPFLLRYNPIFWKFLYFTYLFRKKSLKSFNLLCRSSFIKEFAESSNLTRKKVDIEYGISSFESNLIVHEKIKSIIPNKQVILSIGSLEKIKGINTLIRAYAKVKNKKDSMLLVVGDGTKKEEYRSLAELLGVGGRVYFTGKIDGKYLPWLYKTCSFVALTPLWPEPFSRVMLEALYFGKPIIATEVGGNPDGIINGKNGYLVSNNMDEISEKLEKLISDKKLQKKMGQESKKIFRNKFTKEITITKILDFYNKLKL